MVTYSPVEGTNLKYNIGDSVNITFTATDDELDKNGSPLRNLVSVKIVLDFKYHNLSTSNNKLSGVIRADFFNHLVYYVSKGSSNLIEAATVVKIQDVPVHKEVFKIKPDSVNFKGGNIVNTYTWSDGSKTNMTYNFKVKNNLEFLGPWIENYIKNRY